MDSQMGSGCTPLEPSVRRDPAIIAAMSTALGLPWHPKTDEVLLRVLSQFRFLAVCTPQEVAMFDRYAPRIGPLQLGASFLLVALGVLAIRLLIKK